VTSDYHFNILGYAGQSEDPILLREMEMEGLKKVVFIPPASRRFGTGFVAESVSLAGWHVGWRDTEFKVIVTSVSISEGGLYNAHWNSGPRVILGPSSGT
jgi:hypothetical protein